MVKEKWTQTKNITTTQKPLEFSESVKGPLQDGEIWEKLTITKQEKKEVDTDACTAWIQNLESIEEKTLLNLRKEEKLYMLEYLQEIKKTTSQDNLNISKINAQIMNLLQILEADLTLKGKDLKPFWNTHTEEKSRNLWLPTKIDCADLDSNLLNIRLQYLVKEKSWFSTTVNHHRTKNLQKTYWQSLPFSQPVPMVSENTNLVSRKIQIYPNTKQKKILTNFYGLYRWFYNRAIDKIKEEKQFTLTQIKPKMREGKKFPIPEWANKNLYCGILFSEATNDACKAFQSNFAKCRLNPKHSFDISYKNKKNNIQTMSIEKGGFSTKEATRNSLLIKTLGKMRSAGYKDMHIRIPYKQIDIIKDAKLQWDTKLNKYFLVITYTQKFLANNENQVKSYDMISLDTGVRTFQTGYCPQGHTLEIGKDACKRLTTLLIKKDVIRSLIDKCTNKRKKENLWVAFYRKQRKITNLVDELHWKTCNLLTSNYNRVMLPFFETSNMIKGRKLGKITKRLLNVFSFYKFKQRLIEKCKQTGVKLFLVDESFTSKTCTRCGWLNQSLGKSKTFVCKNCDLNIDRDINGARNILIKNI